MPGGQARPLTLGRRTLTPPLDGRAPSRLVYGRLGLLAPARTATPVPGLRARAPLVSAGPRRLTPAARWTGREGGAAASQVPSETPRESGAAARWRTARPLRGLHSEGCRWTGPCRSRRSRSMGSRSAGWRARDPAEPGHLASEQIRGRLGLPHRLAAYRAAERRSPHRPQPGFPGPATAADGRAQAGVRSRCYRPGACHGARTKRPAAGWRAAWARLTPPAPSQSVMAGDLGTARADSPRSPSISAGM